MTGFEFATPRSVFQFSQFRSSLARRGIMSGCPVFGYYLSQCVSATVVAGNWPNSRRCSSASVVAGANLATNQAHLRVSCEKIYFGRGK